MKYESAILKRLIDTYGVVGNPHYISEIIKEFIVQGKEHFPSLFTYQSDWLAHIDEFGLNPTYTVCYTGQSIYAPNTLEKPVKSAILKGSTKYRDIDTGEFLETFEDGRNLELVSVKMPVLTTTGKNIFDGQVENNKNIDGNTGVVSKGNRTVPVNFIKVEPNTTYTFTRPVAKGNIGIRYYSVSQDFISSKTFTSYTGNFNATFTTPSNCYFIKFIDEANTLEKGYQLECGSAATPYEPYKSNILTVNEDVTLRSNGNVYDELDLITGQFTQRINENNETLAESIVKTVGLTILDQNGQTVKQLMSFNGGTHFTTKSIEGSPLPMVSVSVETDLEETLKVCSLEGNTL